MLKGQSHPEWSLQAPPITRCPGPQQRSCLPLSMSPSQLLLCCLTLLPLACLQGSCLQCFGCNVGGGRGRGRGYVELGCSQPEVINCSQTERGFKLRSCLTTYSRGLGSGPCGLPVPLCRVPGPGPVPGLRHVSSLSAGGASWGVGRVL
ncbi:uncharacterized protein V6R79_012700 [Siganus canaliculatus]